MCTIFQTSRFRKNVKRAKKRYYDLAKLKAAIQTLAHGELLDPSYRDHPLKGEYEGCRDCHPAFG